MSYAMLSALCQLRSSITAPEGMNFLKAIKYETVAPVVHQYDNNTSTSTVPPKVVSVMSAHAFGSRRTICVQKWNCPPLSLLILKLSRDACFVEYMDAGPQITVRMVLFPPAVKSTNELVDKEASCHSTFDKEVLKFKIARLSSDSIINYQRSPVPLTSHLERFWMMGAHIPWLNSISYRP